MQYVGIKIRKYEWISAVMYECLDFVPVACRASPVQWSPAKAPVFLIDKLVDYFEGFRLFISRCAKVFNDALKQGRSSLVFRFPFGPIGPCWCIIAII